MPAKEIIEITPFCIIDNEGYSLKIRKTPVAKTDLWHIEFLADIAGQEMIRHEYFLTESELALLRTAL
jgi:hypothetical protein